MLSEPTHSIDDGSNEDHQMNKKPVARRLFDASKEPLHSNQFSNSQPMYAIVPGCHNIPPECMIDDENDDDADSTMLCHSTGYPDNDNTLSSYCHSMHFNQQHHVPRGLPYYLRSRFCTSDQADRLEDEHRLMMRQKQIDFGKSTVGYQRYIALIPRHLRTATDPWTPEKRAPCSKRNFDGQIRKWRRQLHAWDPDTTIPTSDMLIPCNSTINDMGIDSSTLSSTHYF